MRALLALAFLTACGAHAAPAVQSPATPMPPPAGDVAFAATEGDRAECHSAQNCQLSCPHGGCDIACAPGSTCQATCDGGGCAMSCPAGATCAFSCDGGGCDQTCAQGICSMSCDGGGCDVSGAASSPDDTDRDQHVDDDD
jgi:hypothetical protein